MNDIKVSIIIVHYNTPELLTRCVNSINKYIIDLTKEIIVVDNNSRKDRSPELPFNDDLKIIRLPKNTGFSYANNIGAKAASGEMIFFLNSDTYFKDHSVNKALINFFEKKEKAIWGFKLLWPDGSFQNSYSREVTFLDFILSYTSFNNLSPFIKRISYHKYHNQPFTNMTAVPIVYAAAMLMWKNDFLTLNGFDEKYFMYFEDMDFCYEFRKKLKGEVYHYPDASIIHSGKGSSRKNQKINLVFLKSKYIYGFKKFKFILMSFFIFLDLSLILLTLGYGSIFYKDVEVEQG